MIPYYFSLLLTNNPYGRDLLTTSETIETILYSYFIEFYIIDIITKFRRMKSGILLVKKQRCIRVYVYDYDSISLQSN